jgi:hypothetical protein
MYDIFEIIKRQRKVEKANAEWIRLNLRKAMMLRAVDEILLGIGGRTVEFGGGYLGFVDFHLIRAVMQRGMKFPADGVIMMPGKPSRCHENVDALWHQGAPGMEVATGFALINAVGIWEMHSWGWNVKKRRVIETTERRDAYFGFTMTAREIKNCRVMP